MNITKALATDMTIAFLKEVKASGYVPVLYTNRDYLKNYFDLEKITKEVGTVYIWFALYASKLPVSEEAVADIWQCTSTAKVPGISGNVDLNNFFTDFTAVPAEWEETCNINILNFQKAANADGYLDEKGRKLVEDGKDGANTQYVRKQITLKAKQVEKVWKVGSTGEVVKWWQTRCNEILGHNQKTDGKYGSKARTETMAVQKYLNLTEDGIAGYNSIQAAFYN